MRVTSALRTIFDLASRQSLIEAVVTIDLALHAELLGIQELSSYMALRTGSRGAKTVRRALALADAASESAMESRLRLLIVVGGLPRPEVQTTITDSDDRVLARLDLFYPDALLGIEYDGSTHRDSLIEDDRRQNRLLGAGIRLLRFTASDVYQTPQATLAQIRSELQMAASAGSRGVLRTKKPVSAGTRVGRAAR
jgi:very-short-patch-repair endonuclease